MRKERTTAVFCGLAVLLVLLCGLSILVGSFPLSFAQITDIITGKESGTLPARVFWNLRLPRTVVGLLAGAGLGLAGGVYQTLFRNPLASPDLTGVASGASFGAACAIVLGAGSSVLIMDGAFVAGMLSLLLVLTLVRAAHMERTVT